MNDATLVVFGASGLVGSALCERLYFTGEWKFLAVLHTSGSGARLARLPIRDRVAFADLLKPESLEPLLSDDVIVVNCARGGDMEMRRGFANLVRAAKKRRVRKFIHISSVAIFGEDPPPESVHPSCTASSMLTEYGKQKRWQDEQALALHRSGVPCWILCPGNITGPYSSWSASMARRLAAGPFPLVDGGQYPCNLVYVDNLVEALLAAASAAEGAGERYFVNELSPVSWKQYIEDIGRLLNVSPAWIPLTREEVLSRMRPPAGRNFLYEHLRILASGEFRSALSMLPAFAWINQKAAAAFQALPETWQKSARKRLARPAAAPGKDLPAEASEAWARVQVRRFFHNPESLAKRLGWKPVVSYEKSLEFTSEWLRFVGL